VGSTGRWIAPAVVAAGTGLSLAIGAFAVAVRVAHLVITPSRTRAEDVHILAVDREFGTVTLGDHPDAVVPGEYSLYYSSDVGYAHIGDIVGVGEHSVTRRLLDEVRGELTPGMAGRVSGWFYETPADAGLDFEEVQVDTALGPAPAWLVPAAGESSRWVIQVHGRGTDWREPVRAVPVFHRAGYTSLLVSYRNDGVAPNRLDGRYSLGETEWDDVEAGIRFAIGRGATEVILMGWSMGGALVLQTVTRSAYAALVRGIVLDSPVVDWVRVLDHQATSLKVPAPIRSLVYRMIGERWGRRLTGQAQPIDLRRLDFVRRAEDLTHPALVLHSESDSYVPATGSADLADLRPDLVSYARFTGAGHTRLWNYDRARWEREISTWLSELPPLRQRSSP
jgi:uncharacterized protein